MNWITYWLRNLAERLTQAERGRLARQVAREGKARHRRGEPTPQTPETPA